MTNLVYLTTILVTNWVATGDVKRERGTNYVQLQQIVTTQTMIEEVSFCTNRTIYKVGASLTNGSKWELRSSQFLFPPPLPPAPGLGQ